MKPTKQHREVVPNLAVSSQLGVSVFRYLSTKCRPITTNHKTEANASILRSLQCQKETHEDARSEFKLHKPIGSEEGEGREEVGEQWQKFTN